MTGRELNLEIKKKLKSAGYNAREISVSVKSCGYSEKINVIIKNPEINKREVEKILKVYESISRDEASYEILQGANTYLFVEYLDGIFDDVAMEYEEKAIECMKSNEEIVCVTNGLYLLNMDRAGNYEIKQQDKNDICRRKCYNSKALSVFLYKYHKFGTIAV